MMNKDELRTCDLLACFCRSSAMVFETHPINDVQEISKRNEGHVEFRKIDSQMSAAHKE